MRTVQQIAESGAAWLTEDELTAIVGEVLALRVSLANETRRRKALEEMNATSTKHWSTELAALRAERDALAARVENLEKLSQPAPTPAEPPVWPGLDGEALARVEEAFRTAFNKALARGLSSKDAYRAAYTAEAASLWRAMAASLPTHTTEGSDRVRVGYDFAYRSALAALADPYDGGAK